MCFTRVPLHSLAWFMLFHHGKRMNTFTRYLYYYYRYYYCTNKMLSCYLQSLLCNSYSVNIG